MLFDKDLFIKEMSTPRPERYIFFLKTLTITTPFLKTLFVKVDGRY